MPIVVVNTARFDPENDTRHDGKHCEHDRSSRRLSDDDSRKRCWIPFTHAEHGVQHENHPLSAVSHSAPVVPGRHWHENSSPAASHLPPRAHGSDQHGLLAFEEHLPVLFAFGLRERDVYGAHAGLGTSSARRAATFWRRAK